MCVCVCVRVCVCGWVHLYNVLGINYLIIFFLQTSCFTTPILIVLLLSNVQFRINYFARHTAIVDGCTDDDVGRHFFCLVLLGLNLIVTETS